MILAVEMNEEASEPEGRVEGDADLAGRAVWNRVPRVNVLGVGISFSQFGGSC